MGYVYAGLWVIIAVLLFFRFRRESRSMIPLSLYFVLLGFWWFLNEQVTEDLLRGNYAWILRGVSLLTLLLCVGIYLLERRSAGKEPSAEAKDRSENPESSR